VVIVGYSDGMKSTYFRWTKVTDPDGVMPEFLRADILGTETNIEAHPTAGTVRASVPRRPLDPDEARMIGVRLIEAAALADGGRSVREP
jgi:hypothetical protein